VLSNNGGGIVVGCSNSHDDDFDVVTNNIVVSNNGTGIVTETDGTCTETYQSTFLNNLLYGNMAAYGIKSSNTVSGTVTLAPLFVNFVSSGSGGDYHLQSTSPAINAGTPTGAPSYDLDGYSRPYDRAFDIGAYEYHP
jgi:hypothetical protein